MRLSGKIALLLLPLATAALLLELRLRTLGNSYTQKKQALEHLAPSTEILLLGDSQMEQGIQAALLPHAFNMAHPSQPLCDDSLLAAYYLPRLPKLRLVLVSLGMHRLYEGKSVAGTRQHIYDALYNPESYNPLALARRHLRILQLSPRESLLHVWNNPAPLPEADHGSRLNPDCLLPRLERARLRQRELLGYEEPRELAPNLARLKALQSMCTARGMRFYVLLPPVSTPFRTLQKAVLHQQRTLLQQTQIPYQDYTAALPDSLFADCDHPCAAGAARYTRLVGRGIPAQARP